MVENINKQIEEEAREFAFKSCPYHNSDCKIEHCNSNCQWHRYSQKDDSYKKFKQGAQWMQRKLENSSRWRKVSEELPEYGSIIVAKGDTFDFQDMYLIEIDSDFSMSVLTSYYKEWKPID